MPGRPSSCPVGYVFRRTLPKQDQSTCFWQAPLGSNRMWLGLGALIPKGHSALAAIAPGTKRAGEHEGEGLGRVKLL